MTRLGRRHVLGVVRSATVVAIVAASAPACASDGDTAPRTTTAVTDSSNADDDLLVEGDATVEAAAGDTASDESAPTTSGDAAPSPTDAAEPSDGGGTAAEEEDEADAASPDGMPTDADGVDDMAEIEDIFDLAAVDDVPVCQSSARFFEAVVSISIAGSFAQIDSDDPDAVVVSLSETFELLVYPSLADDVATIRSGDVGYFADYFAPLFDRVDVVPQLLTDAGLSDAEIDELARSPRAGRLVDVDVDTIDPRVREAAVAMTAQFGSFESANAELDEFESVTETDGPAAARFEERCPLLAGSLDAI